MAAIFVLIIGAGPSGLILGHILRRAGIDVLLVEQRDREHVLARVRAGILERRTVELLRELGLADRLDREAVAHSGLVLASERGALRLDLLQLTGGGVTAYGQTEITRDLIDAAPAAGLEILWGVEGLEVEGIDGASPVARFRHDGRGRSVAATFVAGCDGSHGLSSSLLGGTGAVEERVYPYSWLGVLADVRPCHEEVIYAASDRGFALASMRSMTRSRYYIQVDADARIEEWPDARFWEEFERRLGASFAAKVVRGPSIEKSITPLRALVRPTMRHGRLFVAGDAGHIVPPIGAKGLNLAASDVSRLGRAMTRFAATGESDLLEDYSDSALRVVWRTQHFCHHLAWLLHTSPGETEFERRLRATELAMIGEDPARRRSLAEGYVGHRSEDSRIRTRTAPSCRIHAERRCTGTR